jgi:hypothetical protein
VPGTWQPSDNRANDYNVDRERQRAESFSGIAGFPVQDMAMVEDQRGPIADRTREHLVSSDRHIIHIRNRLLRTAKALAAGTEPIEPGHPEAYRYHYAEAVAPSSEEAVRLARERAMASEVDTVSPACPAGAQVAT